jgi:hypothetical protein
MQWAVAKVCTCTPSCPQLNNQERIRMMQRHRTNLMAAELKSLPKDVKTYKSVGKA